MSKISSIHVAICAVLAACSLSAHSAPETLANNGHTYEWISGPFSWDRLGRCVHTHERGPDWLHGHDHVCSGE